MKLIFLNPHHPKNIDGIQRMCKKMNIDLEITDDFTRCKQENYDVLVSNQKYFNPDLIPSSIKIIFGPQLWHIPSGEIVGPLNEKYSKRCVYNSLSTWVEGYVLRACNSLVVPISQFPFAVDTEKFKPSNNEKTLDCLVYFKSRKPELLENVKQILKSKSINYETIIYGHYQEDNYLSLLKKCKFMLLIDAHESQGFGVQEAMSCGVPLLVLDCKSVFDEPGNNFVTLKHIDLGLATSVSYWSDTCGLKTTEIADIPSLVDQMLNTYQTFEPRKFIIETLSEEPCMQRILDYFDLNP
jgi:hypothetical protein